MLKCNNKPVPVRASRNATINSLHERPAWATAENAIQPSYIAPWGSFNLFSSLSSGDYNSHPAAITTITALTASQFPAATAAATSTMNDPHLAVDERRGTRPLFVSAGQIFLACVIFIDTYTLVE